MANSLGNYGERVALDAASGVSPASNRWVALYTNNLAADGTGTEVANANGYARVAVTFSAASTLAGVTTSSNTNEVLFAVCNTANWGNIQSIGIWDSGTYGAGNLLWYGNLTTPKLVEVDDQLRFAIGSIDLTMD